MKKLELEQYENIVGGIAAIDGMCAAVGVASLVALTNFWNPVGWIAAALVVGSVGCVGYAIGSHL